MGKKKNADVYKRQAEKIVCIGTLERSQIWECVNVGITDLSPAGTYFQEVEPVLRTFQEFFVSNGPSLSLIHIYRTSPISIEQLNTVLTVSFNVAIIEAVGINRMEVPSSLISSMRTNELG